MKEFKRVTQNDLLLEFLKYVNENVWVDITNVEVEKYEEYTALFHKSKEIFVKLDNDKYHVILFYNGLEYEAITTFHIYQTREDDDVELFSERIDTDSN